MIDIYSGDPRLFLTERGSSIIFKGGQPVMDQGVENSALIDLFTKKGWFGNSLEQEIEKQIGSEFMETASRPVTATNLLDTARAVEEALSADIYGTVTATVTNPNSYIVRIKIIIEPPANESTGLLLTKNGLNWLFQKFNPASERV